MGKLIISKKNFYFSRETTEVLGQVQFLKSIISSQVSISIPFNIKQIPPVLAVASCCFYLDKRILWELSLNSQLWQDIYRKKSKILKKGQKSNIIRRFSSPELVCKQIWA